MAQARDIPVETHSGNLNRTKVNANPEMGTRTIAGKTNMPTSVMTDAYKATPEAVRDAKSDDGACLKAGLKQRTTSDGTEASNPKHRTQNHWGVCESK